MSSNAERPAATSVASPAALDLDADALERQAAWHEQQAAALRAIARGIRAYRGEVPIVTNSVAGMVREQLASNDRVKASELRRMADGSKAVDRALRLLVDHGEAVRLGDGWYERAAS